jgi:hypothetical protein
MAAIIPAIAAVAGLGLQAAGSASANNAQANAQYAIEQQRLAEARQNADYQRALTAMAQRQAQAGYTDASGSTIAYDPATNTWKTTLGPQAQAQNVASIAAQIARDTTDTRRAQQANEQELMRAAAARPSAEAARLRAEQFQPIQAADLAGLLETRAATAQNDALRSTLQTVLANAARTGTSAAPIVTSLQSNNADQLRKAIIDARIAAMTGADQINQQRQQGLNANVAATGGQTAPNLQYASPTGADPNKALAAIAADRARNSTLAAVYGGGNVNTATNLMGGASGATAGAVPNSNLLSTGLISAGQQVGALGKDKDLMASLTTLFGPAQQPKYTGAVGGGFGI